MNVTSPEHVPTAGAPRRQLSIWDTTSIIVGIIIGSGLYESTPTIANMAASSGWVTVYWVLGGVFALVGALCYCELATAYPEEGGDYVFLKRAFGRGMGFVFAWAQLWVIRPGTIGSMAFVFARYAGELYSLGDHSMLWYAGGSVLIVSMINALGVREGKTTQNLLSGAKLLGLAVLIGIGLTHQAPSVGQELQLATAAFDWSAFGLAMIFVLYAYGGWNDMAYVAAEVRDPDRNIVRALLLGTLTVTAIYLLSNWAFLHALGFAGVKGSSAVASDVAGLLHPVWGPKCISLLVCVSALSAINGQIFTGARIFYAMGKEHRMFAPLGHWSQRWDGPLVSLLVQTVITLAVMWGFGVLGSGDGGDSAFVKMVIFTAPVFWGFLILSGISLPLLRWLDPDRPRPFRTPALPLMVAVFLLFTGYMLYSSIQYGRENSSYEAFWAIGLTLLGVVLALFDTPRRSRDQR